MSTTEELIAAKKHIKERITAQQAQDANSRCLTDYASKNSVAAYNDLTQMNNMRERTKDFPNDSNDYKARLHDISWSSRNDIAFVGQANDLVISDGESGYWKNIIKLPSMALSVTFSPNGNLVSTACLDATNTCRIYNVNAVLNKDSKKNSDSIDSNNSDNSNNEEKKNNNTLEDQLTKTKRSIDHSEGMVISHPFLNNEEILSATRNVVYLWDIETGNANGLFCGHSEKTEISTVAAMNNSVNSSSNNSKVLFLSGDDSGCIKLWDVRNNSNEKCVMTWYDKGYFETEVSCIEFLPNNECFIAGSKDGSLRLFDIRNNYKQLNSYQSWYQLKKNKTIPLTAIKLSQSGRFVFAAFDDTEDDEVNWNLVECIEIVTGKSCQQFRHESVVPGIALSPDGHSIVTACWNGKIRKFSSM